MYKSNKDQVVRAITKAEQNALKAMGFLVEAEAKLRCTVDTGTLRRSITSVVNDGEKSVTIGTNMEYAVYVEKGTSKQQAQPYLTPAAEENKEKLKEIASKYLRGVK